MFDVKGVIEARDVIAGLVDAGDIEAAHCEEDDLFRDFVDGICSDKFKAAGVGVGEVRVMAKAMQAVARLAYPRNCA